MSRRILAILMLLAPLGACATVSVYEPASAEISLTAAQSDLHRASADYCAAARGKGLATGEASIGSFASIFTGAGNDKNAYWRRIGADRSAPASVAGRVRVDMAESAKGLVELAGLAHSMMGKTAPTKTDVNEFEKALIHARQSRDSFSDALNQVNKRSNREYKITEELSALDQALAAARKTADALAEARTETKSS